MFDVVGLALARCNVSLVAGDTCYIAIIDTEVIPDDARFRIAANWPARSSSSGSETEARLLVAVQQTHAERARRAPTASKSSS